MKRSRKISKYDFSNPESQKLFEEFTILLADITKYIKKKEERVIYLENELTRVTRIRYMFWGILNKLLNTIKIISLSFKEKLLTTAKKLRDKLKTLLK